MPSSINLLIIGDIIGKAGRRALTSHLASIIDEHNIDFVVGNGENLANGFGTTEATAHEMFDLGVHVLTNGNHCWDQRDFMKVIDEDDRLIRPCNFTEHAPGRGWTLQETASGHGVAVINVIGQVFMSGTWSCPFTAVDHCLQEIPKDVSAIVVDFHAEVTSEKIGMGWHLDGRASVVYGTHTHIPTCDEIIRPKGTAYQSDIGMTGSYQSIIGMKVEGALKKMITRMPSRFECVDRGASIFATIVQINPATRMAKNIKRIHIPPSS
ncbi:MAG: YmdB family metallophosphoesterase [Zetaproteobacteria bacterium]|nr:YmdB family metallophosphoesterase [Zetaproteobacteria bacterium]